MATHIRRREFIFTLGGGAAAWPLAARAQQGQRMRRVGVLMTLATGDPEARLRVVAFEQGLRDLGWVDARNIRMEYHWTTDDSDGLRSEVAALVATAPDLIFVNNTPVL